VSSPLRGAEIDACVHRIALARAEISLARRTPSTPELERRRREARDHRDKVLAVLREIHPAAVTASGHEHTKELIREGVELIVQPRLADSDAARRSTSVQAFIRVGRNDEHFSYAPLVVKNHEVVENGSTRRLLEGSLDHLLPSDAQVREGLGLRSTPTVRRDGLLLAGALRILESLGAADSCNRGAVVDRTSRMWWLELDSSKNVRSNLKAYDALYLERLDVLRRLDAWFDAGGDFPTMPYWHRECLTCQFAQHCEDQLESIDDVSLTRFTTVDQQRALHDHNVHTRTQLARLDPSRAQRGQATPTEGQRVGPEVDLSRTVERLDELIYRARAHVHRSSLRLIAPEVMGCPTADVEVDIDMESYNDATYLWGASVSVHRAVEGVASGHCAFAEWGQLTLEAESANFAVFWSWLSEIRRRCHIAGRTFAAYCFWAQAEDGAMNRAVATPVASGPTMSDLDEFRNHIPLEWLDLHEYAKRQIQTEGPLGLKQLARAAGFSWRDENPSGEASMQWYEIATGDDSVAALASRERILDYNEDDCRATKALRDWLNGPAKLLAHRDDAV
jgi:predicted RecB family nuclease